MDFSDCYKCFSSHDDTSNRINRIIEQRLKIERDQLRTQVKVLLLGSGESGKSTFIKQMRIINGKDFLEEELKMFKTIVYSNIILGMKVLIDATNKLGLKFEKGENIRSASIVFAFDSKIKLEEPVFQQYVKFLSDLWGDGGIQAAFERRHEFLLGDSTRYFMDNLKRISQTNYMPSNLDILYSRKATKGVNEYEIKIRGANFQFVDVGGQRSQRQKWFQCFQDVKSILFMVSSSEFDQVIYEDRKTNRLVESCAIFDTVANNRAFHKVSIILFLNKTDLLAEKVKLANISNYFPAFKGNPHLLTDVQQFLVNLFKSYSKDRAVAVFHHFTTAVDTENIKLVFNDVRETILAINLKSLMLH